MITYHGLKRFFRIKIPRPVCPTYIKELTKMRQTDKELQNADIKSWQNRQFLPKMPKYKSILEYENKATLRSFSKSWVLLLFSYKSDMTVSENVEIGIYCNCLSFLNKGEIGFEDKHSKVLSFGVLDVNILRFWLF